MGIGCIFENSFFNMLTSFPGAHHNQYNKNLAMLNQYHKFIIEILLYVKEETSRKLARLPVQIDFF